MSTYCTVYIRSQVPPESVRINCGLFRFDFVFGLFIKIVCILCVFFLSFHWFLVEFIFITAHWLLWLSELFSIYLLSLPPPVCLAGSGWQLGERGKGNGEWIIKNGEWVWEWELLLCTSCRLLIFYDFQTHFVYATYWCILFVKLHFICPPAIAL